MKKLSIKEKIICISLYTLLSLSAAWLFYDSLIASLFFIPFVLPFLKAASSVKQKRSEHELAGQFIRMLASVSASLCAGISCENAFVVARYDMEKLYGKRSGIVKQLSLINSKVAMGQRIEVALFDLAKRVKIPEIYDFSVVFSVAKEKGGDFASVISSCIQMMEDKRSSEEEAKVMIRARQYEQRVMCIIPPGILLYLRFSSGSFISVLYHNMPGITVMTACLSVYVLAVCLAEKIGDVSI